MSYVSIICQCLAQDILIDPITDLLVRFLSLSQKLKLCVWSHCKFQSPLDLHPKRTTTISIARFRSTPPSVHVTLSDPQHAPPTLPTPIHMHPHKHAHTRRAHAHTIITAHVSLTPGIPASSIPRQMSSGHCSIPHSPGQRRQVARIISGSLICRVMCRALIPRRGSKHAKQRTARQ